MPKRIGNLLPIIFQFTPLREGRRSRCGQRFGLDISIHAPA